MRTIFAPALILVMSSTAFAQESAPEPVTPSESSPAAPAPEVVVPEGDSIEATPPDAAVTPPQGEPVPTPPGFSTPPYPPPPPRSGTEVTPAEPDSDVAAEGPEPDDGLFGSHQTHFTFQLGVRTTFVSDPGFDLFSENDAFVQVGLNGGRVLFAEGPLSVAALLGWDYGSAGSTARGVTTDLEQHRLWMGGEARYHVLRRLYAFVRFAPALLSTRASLRDPIAETEREAGGWMFGADGSAGAAFEVFGKAKGGSSNPRGWVTADGGYTWAEREDLSFSASEDDSAPTRTASLDLGDLALRGGFFRVGVAVTF
jgi:hypothetical protein